MKLIKQMKNLKVKIAEKFKGKFVRKSKGKLKGKMEEKSATISQERDGTYYISILYEYNEEKSEKEMDKKLTISL